MKIAVNVRLLLKDRLEGIGWFTYQTLKHITREHLEDDFVFFFDRPYPPEFVFSPNVEAVVLYPQARHPWLWRWYFELSLPQALKKHQPDVFLSTDGWTTLKKVPCKILNVVHDINFEHHPEFIENKGHLKYYQNYGRKYAKQADRIATVSAASKQDLIKTYQIPEERIDVVYSGINELYYPLADERKQEARDKYSQGMPYFLFVGSLHRRKNLANLLKAFDLYKERKNDQQKLLIVGEKMWKAQEIELAFSQLKHTDDVIFTGFLPDSELNAVVNGATALTFVSLFEGFGLPIVEAFKAGTPVITSERTSMPEIAADAALLCDPTSPESIANSMIELSEQPELQEQLRQKGLARALDFSWKKTANLLWDSIQKTQKQ